MTRAEVADLLREIFREADGAQGLTIDAAVHRRAENVKRLAAKGLRKIEERV